MIQDPLVYLVQLLSLYLEILNLYLPKEFIALIKWNKIKLHYYHFMVE